MRQDIFKIVCLEVAVVGLMKQDQEGHDLTHGQRSVAFSGLYDAADHLSLHHGQKSLAKIIDIAE